MLSALTAWKETVTLTPFSGVQFLDFAFDLDECRMKPRSFLERRDTSVRTADGAVRVVLHPLSGDPEKDAPFLDDRREEDVFYDISKVKALEPFLGKWVPVPWLRIRPGRGPWGEEILDTGPTNWARVRVVPAEEKGPRGRTTHRAVFAFDTELAERVENRAYLVPSFKDAENEQEFRFAAKPEDMAWYLAWPEQTAAGDPQKWVDDWLEELFRELKQAQRPGRPLREEDFPYQREHWARYITFLALLDEALKLPKLRLLDTVSADRRYHPVNVDLVLDIGNSRTCGILIETYPDKPVELDDCFTLRLRDLIEPHRVYEEPFESRVEFAQAEFGKEHLARRAGRARSFFWPSLVRVGPEAVRMAGDAEGTERTTGMSSPKRYLWSVEPVNQEWSFQRPGETGVARVETREDPGVVRAARRFLTETGEVIRQIELEEKQRLRRPKGDARKPAIRSKFSRSSLYGFMLGELIAQALVLINDPGLRSGRKQSDVPRRLRQIIITLPPATPLPEQRIMRSRAAGAVKLVWDLMGWSQHDTPALREPQVTIRWDEASCAHLVWLYGEITGKFAGQISAFFELVGKARPFADDALVPPPAKAAPEPSLRIASVDVGGGTTDLMITTYYVEDKRAIKPTQNFREGFKIAGDDVLRAVVQRMVLPTIQTAVEAAGVSSARELLNGLFGGDWGNMAEPQKQLRRLFVNRACLPIALAMLHAYESAEGFTDMAPRILTFAELMGADPERLAEIEAGELIGERVAAYLEGEVRRQGGLGFRLATVPFAVDLAQLDAVIRNVLRQVMSHLAEAIFALDCDIVLVTGRPSRLPTLENMLIELLPVPPDRIVPMHRYRAGRWYPFRSKDNARIDDPKTTAAVGGMLCVLAESQIQNFALDTRRLVMRSTARFIGEMERNGQILDDRLIFRDVDLDKKAAASPGEAKVRLNAPLQIGFRQLPLERWMATPLYRLEFANPQTLSRMARPLTVTLARVDVDIDIEGDHDGFRRQQAEALKEEFVVTEVAQADGGGAKPSDVVLRLQTLGAEESYWLDSGIVPVQ